MKKLLISSALLWIAITLFSCRGDSGSREAMLNHYKKVYKLSLTYGDYIAAENAIYRQWALDTANAVSYKDSLAGLYFRSGQFIQSVVLGKEILAVRPYDPAMMEIVAEADQRINNLEEALTYDQAIYSKTHDLFHLYQIAGLQFNLGRVDECNKSVDQIIADAGSTDQKVQIAVGQGQMQNVSYKAAALNIRGVIAKGLKQTEEARKSFTDALAIEPNFALAKNNLAGLK